MGRLVLTPTTLRWALTRTEKVLGCTREVVVERSAIESARAVPSVWSTVRGWRAPGYGMPRHRLLGTWRSHGRKDFVDVRYGTAGVVVDLVPGQRFARLVLTVDDPEATAAELSPLR